MNECSLFSQHNNDKRPFLIYNPNMGIFEIEFDGNPNNQYEILKILIDNGVKIIDFSVPRGNLLEDLYLELIKKSETLNIKEMKTHLQVRQAF